MASMHLSTSNPSDAAASDQPYRHSAQNMPPSASSRNHLFPVHEPPPSFLSAQHSHQQHENEQQPATWQASHDHHLPHPDDQHSPPSTQNETPSTPNYDYDCGDRSYRNPQLSLRSRSAYHAQSPQEPDRFGLFHYHPHHPSSPVAAAARSRRQFFSTSPHTDGIPGPSGLDATAGASPWRDAPHFSPQTPELLVDPPSSVSAAADDYYGAKAGEVAQSTSYADQPASHYVEPHVRREDDHHHYQHHEGGYDLPLIHQQSYYSTPRSQPDYFSSSSNEDPSSPAPHSAPSSVATPASYLAHPSTPASHLSQLAIDSPGGQSSSSSSASRYAYQHLSRHPSQLGIITPPAPPLSTVSYPPARLRPVLRPISASLDRLSEEMNAPADPNAFESALASSPLDHQGYLTDPGPRPSTCGDLSPGDPHPTFEDDYPGECPPGCLESGCSGIDSYSPSHPQSKRSKKVEMACHFCRFRKLKCDGARPACYHCARREQRCTWDAFVRRRGPGQKNKPKVPKGGVTKRGSGSKQGSSKSSKSSKGSLLGDLVEEYHRELQAAAPTGRRKPGRRAAPRASVPPPAPFEDFPPPHRPYTPVSGHAAPPMMMGTPFSSVNASPLTPYQPQNHYAYPQGLPPISSSTQVSTSYAAPTQYPGDQQYQPQPLQYVPPPPSPPFQRVIPQPSTPSSSLAGAMGADAGYSGPAYGGYHHPAEGTTAWRRYSNASGPSAEPSAYVPDHAGSSYQLERENGSYLPYQPQYSSPVQPFSPQAPYNYGHTQQYTQPVSSTSTFGYGYEQQQEQYTAQPRTYATTQQVASPVQAYEGGGSWVANGVPPAAQPVQQTWQGYTGYAAQQAPTGTTSSTDATASSTVRAPVREEIPTWREPYQVQAPNGTTASGSASSAHSTPSHVGQHQQLYDARHPTVHPSAPVTTLHHQPAVMSNQSTAAMQTSASADTELAESLINLAHSSRVDVVPGAGGGMSLMMQRRSSNVTISQGAPSSPETLYHHERTRIPGHSAPMHLTDSMETLAHSVHSPQEERPEPRWDVPRLTRVVPVNHDKKIAEFKVPDSPQPGWQ